MSVPSEYEEYLTADRYDGFLVALLYPAMTYGEDIEVDGMVSKRLLRNINTQIQDILLAYNSKLQRINILAKELTGEILPTAKHIGTGFSGGVDSFSTIYDNFVLENDPEYRIDILTCFNVGSHCSGTYIFTDERTNKLFHDRYNFLKPFTDTVNLPYIPIDSNIHYFHEDGHQKTCTLTLAAGVLTVQKMFSKYYVASLGFDYTKWIDVAPKYQNFDIAGFADPYLLPLLSTETTKFILDGMQYTRVQKTIRLIKYPLTKQYINVCLDNEPQKKNCGSCPKCARLGLTLSIMNKLDDYKDVFDIEAYRKNEYKLMCQAVLEYGSNPFMTDIVDFANLHNKQFPTRLEAETYLKSEQAKSDSGNRTIFSQSPLKYIKPVIRKILGKKLTSKIKHLLRRNST